MPIIGKSFEWIAMDITGPLPKTTSGHQYILVISDYATRFPEAYPLMRFTAISVTDKLIDLFSRVGIPNEILTDQGTNFRAAEGIVPDAILTGSFGSGGGGAHDVFIEQN